jgi:hypothetical protein
MLTIFGDESYDKDKSVFALSGMIGTHEEWEAFEPLWIERTNGIPFHATDCAAGRGDYKGVPKSERDALYRDLVKLIIASPLMGLGSVMDNISYKACFPSSPPQTNYIHCLVKLIHQATELTHLYLPTGQEVEFVFDTNFDVQYNATELFDAYVRYWEKEELKKYLSTISYKSSRKCIGLQVTDLWAREIMKYGYEFCHNSNARPIRISLDKLLNTNRFKCDILDISYWEDYKKQYPHIAKEQGTTYEEYIEWINSKRIKNDNLGVRINYIKHIKAKQMK